MPQSAIIIVGKTTAGVPVACQVDSGGKLVTTAVIDSEFPAAAALADATANPTTTLVEALLGVFNGTTWDRLRGDTTNGVDADVTRLALQTTNRLTDATYYGATAADNITIAAVASQKHRVYYYEIIVSGATIIKIRDGAAGTILRQYDFAGAGSAVCDMLPSLDPLLVGTANTALVVNSTAAVTQNLVVKYTTAA